MNARRIVAVAAVGLALLLTVVAAEARGPRASLLSETECALFVDAANSVADLIITTTLTNKSSGDTVAEVRDGTQIQGTFKKQAVRGRAFFPLDAAPVPIPEQDVVDTVMETATFDLCAEQGNVTIAREFNGEVTVVYGISGGVGPDRDVVNRCTDDPETEGVNEGGIKVDDATFSAIAGACGW